MNQCPACNSTRISQEKWYEAAPNAFQFDGDVALGQINNLKCNDCGYTSTPCSFQKQDSE